MGIRIYKSLGYGLDFTNIPEADISKLDFEFETNKDFSDWREECIKEAEASTGIDRTMMQLTHKRINETNTNIEFYNFHVYAHEFGVPNFVQFVPWGFVERWTRYDDSIDFYDYMAKFPDGRLDATIDWIDGTLYPYINLMRANPDKPFGYETFWETCWKDKEEFKNSIPAVPLDVYFTMKKLQIVPDEKLTETFLKLRPCIYTYWS